MNQASLNFEAPALATARAAGELLAEKAADRAERSDPDFRERAQTFVLRYLTEYGISSSELITDAAVLAGISPPDTRAFGSVYRKLSRENKIVCAGFCARAKGHGTAGGRLWRLAGA
jgi:hypothetical protein